MLNTFTAIMQQETSMPTLTTRLCVECGKAFIPRRDWQKYCSTQHRVLNHWKNKIQGGAPPDPWWDNRQALPAQQVTVTVEPDSDEVAEALARAKKKEKENTPGLKAFDPFLNLDKKD
jgi:hypothetical protein